MIFSLEEMNLLADKLEKEKANILNQDLQEQTTNDIHHLEIISYLQERLADQEADLYEEEKQYIASLIQDEVEHIHGNGKDVYQSILDKVQ
ncbi:hypothetical protein [Shimazuella kribbensis]|uniref:hypothetical protein n=1 Tax=Shimazuella kribbensis TaxID=139808 RepID=UPI000423FD05|nr:hypothetical protein [Shimazuella kribbensis]